eukprot:GHVN01045941.1.p1 GENE.GHVN01045941.1~~GHVN01045941.1.p1  ORF type:complete len:256 (+),score=36.69 GHVN01045941.1:42-770(+)
MATLDVDALTLSVQGSLFILKQDFILSQDWILKEMVTSAKSWKENSSDGQVYLDVDPHSFRFIIAVLSGVFSLPMDAHKLSTMDLALTKATARHLMLEGIANELAAIESGWEATMKTKDDEIRKNKEETKDLEEALRITSSLYEDVKDTLDCFEKLETQFLCCDTYRTHRPGNKCGSQSIIIGPLSVKSHLPGVDILTCDACEEAARKEKKEQEMGCQFRFMKRGNLGKKDLSSCLKKVLNQ